MVDGGTGVFRPALIGRSVSWLGDISATVPVWSRRMRGLRPCGAESPALSCTLVRIVMPKPEHVGTLKCGVVSNIVLYKNTSCFLSLLFLSIRKDIINFIEIFLVC